MRAGMRRSLYLRALLCTKLITAAIVIVLRPNTIVDDPNAMCAREYFVTISNNEGMPNAWIYMVKLRMI